MHNSKVQSATCSAQMSMGESMAREGAAKRASGSGSSESGDSDVEITGVQLAPRLAQHLNSIGLGLGLKHKGGKAAARSHSAATATAGSQLCSSSTSLASIDSAASSASSAYASGTDQSSSSSNSVCQPPPTSASLHSTPAPAPAHRDLSFSPSAAPSQQPQQHQQQHLLVYQAPAAISPHQLQLPHPVSPLVTSSVAYYMGAPQADSLSVYATPASERSDMSLSAECAMEAEESLATHSQQTVCALGLYSSWLQQPAFRAAPGKLVELSASTAYAQQSPCWAAAGDAPQTHTHAHLLPLDRWLHQQLVAAAAFSNSSGM